MITRIPNNHSNNNVKQREALLSLKYLENLFRVLKRMWTLIPMEGDSNLNRIITHVYFVALAFCQIKQHT